MNKKKILTLILLFMMAFSIPNWSPKVANAEGENHLIYSVGEWQAFLNDLESTCSNNFTNLTNSQQALFNDYSFLLLCARNYLNDSLFTDSEGNTLELIDTDAFNSFLSSVDTLLSELSIEGISNVSQLFIDLQGIINTVIEGHETDAKGLLAEYGLYRSSTQPTLCLKPAYNVIETEGTIAVDLVLSNPTNNISNLYINNLGVTLEYSDELELTDIARGDTSIIQDSTPDYNDYTDHFEVFDISQSDEVAYGMTYKQSQTLSLDAPEWTIATFKFTGTSDGLGLIDFAGDDGVIAQDPSGANCAEWLNYGTTIQVVDTLDANITHMYVNGVAIDEDGQTIIAENDFTVSGFVDTANVQLFVNEAAVDVDAVLGLFSFDFTGVTGTQEVEVVAGEDSYAFTVIVDTEGPVIALTNPETGVVDTGLYKDNRTITFTYEDEIVTEGETLVSVTLNGESITDEYTIANNYLIQVADGAEEDFTLEIVAEDALGNSTTKTITFTIDRIPPEVKVIGVEDGEKYAPTSIFIGVSEGTFTAELNDAPYVNGTLIPDSGSYTLVVTATDEAGNITTETRDFEIDGEAPSVVSGSVSIEPTLANGSATIEVAFEVSELLEEGYLDVGFISINNLIEAVEQDGKYTVSFNYDVPEDVNAKYIPIKVTLLDACGNESDVITLGTITIDNQAPRVFLLEDAATEYGYKGYIVGDALELQIITDGNRIAWAVDNETLVNPTEVNSNIAAISWSADEVPFNDGNEHTVYYQAFDAAGNSTDVLSYTFKWDNVHPDKPVIANTTSITNDKSIALTSNAVLEDGSKIFVEKQKNGKWISAKTTDAFPIEGIQLAEGANSFRVILCDVAGNMSEASDAYEIVRDTIKPLIKIEKVEGEDQIIITASENVQNIRYTLNADNEVVLTDLSLTANIPSDPIDIAFAEGNNKLIVKAEDEAGNEGVGHKSYHVIAQQVNNLPLTDGLNLQQGNFAEAGTLEVNSVIAATEDGQEFVAEPLDFSGVQVEQGKSVVIDLNLGSNLPESTKLWYLDDKGDNNPLNDEWYVLDGNEHGDSIYNPSENDSMDNYALDGGTFNDIEYAQQTVNVAPGHLVAAIHHFSTFGPMADTTPPEVVITSPAANASINANALVGEKVVVTGTLSETADVTVNGSDAVVNNNTFTAAISLGQGAQTITVIATDDAENATTETVDVFVDTIAPTITTFNGLVSTNKNPDELTLNVNDDNAVSTKIYAGSVTDDNLIFSTSEKASDVEVAVDLTEGSNTFIAVAIDEFGNSSEESATVTLDTVGPAITISGISDGDMVNNSVEDIFVALDESGDWTATLYQDENPVGTDYTDKFTVNVEADKHEYTLVVNAQDDLGNLSSKEISFIIDNSIPTITVNGVTDGLLTKEDVTVTITSDVDNVLSALNKDNVSIAFESGDTLSEDGVYSLVAMATNTVSNKTATKTVEFTIDNVAPTIDVAGIKDEGTYTKSATPVITVHDNHSSDNAIVTTITLNGGNFVSGTKITEKTTHTLEVTATDEAGNTNTASFSFRVKSSSSSGGGSYVPPVPEVVVPEELPENTVAVSATGGSFNFVADEVNVIIEEGTFAEDVTMTVELVEENIPALPEETPTTKLRFAGKVYEFNAEGKDFNKPVTVAFTYDPEKVDDPNTLGVYVYNEETGNWDYVGGAVDPETGTVTVTLPHFSKYAVMSYARTFTDVTNHWAKGDIEYMASKHIASGRTLTEYVPNGKITRAEFAVHLVRALRLEHTTQACKFVDVKEGKWYAADVATAYEAGLVGGVSATEYAPDANITREQMATMIMRAYSKMTGIDLSTIVTTMQIRFNDEAEISPYAHPYVILANDFGIVGGMGQNMFAPKADATRAQAIVMIRRLLDVVNK